MSTIAASKAVVARFHAALYDCDSADLPRQLSDICHADCKIRLAHPLGDVIGPDALFETAYQPLLNAIPDLERREYIAIGGTESANDWICCAGSYTGVFEAPWLDIPPTRNIVTLRYIEFFEVIENSIVTMRLLWDIPSLMMQANAWPMGPSLGIEFNVPGPATHDGIIAGASDPNANKASMELVKKMLAGLAKFQTKGAAAMNLGAYWHPKMNWYGPGSIGSNRRISGFRNWHQIPFLNAMPDRAGNSSTGGYDCFFADGNYVAFCGWPAMTATISHDGWLGIAPSGQEITMASLDIWRCENGLLRENWVLVDILDIWNQVGVDVLARMKTVTFERQPHDFQN